MSSLIKKLRELQNEMAKENLPTAFTILVEPQVIERVASEWDGGWDAHGIDLELEHGTVRVGLW